MNIKVDWNQPVLPENTILKIQPSDLSDFYAAASDGDKTNLFFVLLTSFHHYRARRLDEKAAHLAFLIAFYLFTPLTPPGSWELAMHYIREAVALHPCREYQEWLSLMEAGN